MKQRQITVKEISCTISVPFTLKRKQFKKFIVLPPTAPKDCHFSAPPDYTLIRTVARAHYWQSLLDQGSYDTVEALAKGVKANVGYLRSTLRLTHLAPNIIERILAGVQPKHLRVGDFIEVAYEPWEVQREKLEMPLE